MSAELELMQSLIRDGFDNVKSEFANTNTIIQSIDTKINNIRQEVDNHSDRLNTLEKYTAGDYHRIDSLTHQVELLKQDRLRNNLRLTGLPPDAFVNVNNTVMTIIEVMKMDLIPSDFVAYSDRNQSSIIITFDFHSHKKHFMNTLRQRNELLVEEIFPAIRSNSRIYCNDQLTPHYASLFQKAWQAKKQNQIISASSLGGRIKVKKTVNSSTVIIETEQQLNDIINMITSMESTNTTENGSTNSESIQTNRLSNRNPELLTQTSTTANHSIQSTSTINTKPAVTFQRKFPDRSQQYHQLRSKPNGSQHSQFSRHNQRFKHQDYNRHIEPLPNRHHRSNTNKRSTHHDPPSPINFHNRNY